MTTESLPRTPAELGLPELPIAALPADPAVHHVRAKLDREIRALLAHEPGTRSGADPEDLHQMRVALRRMRSVLKLSGELVGDGAEPVRAELGWLGQSLGEVRDYDVLIGHLREVIAGFEVRDQAAGRRLVSKFVAERATAKRRLTRALSSARYSTLLREVSLLTRAESTSAVTRPHDLVSGLAKPHRKLAKAVRALPADPPDDDLHALRIHGKKLRYAAELAQTSAKKKQTAKIKQLLKATKDFQTVLGEHQDAVIAAERMRTILESVDGPMGFVAGRIAERELSRRAEARAVWRKSWKAVDSAAKALHA
ncbi:CHAD domain-containing protein [Amycolatopsis mediterranei S699]|uniref:CHAD domain-containing protein n=2 Tax=Amycolatopsis mediterranei TaxID=33910 RepID=A0A0H3CX02_AMYMU|nr:CHAD domain-containing protein [Amycolatopsis mediterranei]ADJ42848.1 CHAD domain-containing protein [Amycolatopsis mediterranei U32]AEK39540.1 CHAD domain-containing protein [Amycolatopsis mediterranei S699]AFO74562.1 CHAD domain-containing protein [Amycolatopsis mediterranei S699]AGT81691.1 CHAD domain-containing protein [Amycolatopsis mediterranei RB]KDO10147.1 metal-chelation protein CHAD [Amycolatopsis mediterranei]